MPDWFLIGERTISHFLWQGSVLGLAVLAIRPLQRNWSSRLKYKFLLATLALLLLLPALTGVVIWRRSLAALSPAELIAKHNQSLSRPVWAFLSLEPSDWRSLIACALGAGAVFMLLRLFFFWIGGKIFHSRSTPLMELRAYKMITSQASRLGMSTTPSVAEFSKITGPCIVGILKPVLLLPANLKKTLSPKEINWIIGHELAHIRRSDSLVNFFQRLIEALLFFHPTTSIVGRLIRFERECCCDDAAMEDGRGDTAAYGRLLLRLAKAARADGRPASGYFAPMLGSTFITTTSDLTVRIARMLGSEAQGEFQSKEWRPLSTTLLALTLIVSPLLLYCSLAASSRLPSIHLAARSGNIGMVDSIFAQGESINRLDSDGNSPLYAAAQSGDPKVVARVLDLGADPVQKIGALHRSALHQLLAVDPVRATTEIIAALAPQECNVPDDRGMTAGLLAAQLADPGVLKAMLPNLSLSQRDRAGKTLLHIAASSGNVGNVSLLLDAGAPVDAVDISGATPLDAMIATSKPFAQLRLGAPALRDKCALRISDFAALGLNDELEEALNRPGVNANASEVASLAGRTALHFAVRHLNVEGCRILLRHGGDPLQADALGLTPVDLAISHTSPARLLELLVAHVDLSRRPNQSFSPLQLASTRCIPESVAVLLQAHADPNERTEDGSTCLMLLTRRSKIISTESGAQVARMLIAGGANPGMKNPSGLTALDLADPSDTALRGVLTGNSK